MKYTAQATTGITGAPAGMYGELRVDSLGTGDKFDPWKIQTSMFGEKMRLSEVRDNIRDFHRLNAYGTLVMFALRNGFTEDELCRVADNKKNICYDLYCGDVIFRKLNDRHYKRKAKKVRKGA